LVADPTVRPALIYSNSFGGHGSDAGTAVAVDSAGNVYVAGTTTSSDFPVENALQPQIGGTPLRTSTDNGKTWSTSAIPEGIFAVAGSPKAPGVLYAGASSTIYKSTDAGKTWAALKSAPAATVNALIVDPVTPAVVYAATTAGVFKSVDAGGTWVASFQKGLSVLDLVMDPARPSTLFAGIASSSTSDPTLVTPAGPNVYRSTDAGATWTLLASSPGGTFALAGDPSNPDVLYAAASPDGDSAFAGQVAIYKTADGGNTWSKLTDASIPASTFALAAGPGTVYAATSNGVIRSLDGGVTWTTTTVTAAADNLAVDPITQIVYANAGGIFVSTDGGTTWISSLPVRQNVQTIAVVPGAVFVGATPGQNVFVTKWSADGKQMLYSTYLGSSYYDVATGIAVDGQGNAYVTGYTYATDFPVTRGVLQSQTAAAYAGFLAKISPDGGTLVYSTYLSGSTGDSAFAIAVDGSGNAYLTGYAGSADFPVTPGAFQSHIQRNCATAPKGVSLGEAFVAKVNADASALVYSTLLGGSCGDEGFGIAVDASGSAYVVGVTQSGDFPATKGAFQPASPGLGETGFLAKLTPQGSALAMASFIGGGHDSANAVTVDGKGNVYITGCTIGFDQPIFSNGIFGISLGGGLPTAGFSPVCTGAAYVLKLDPAAAPKVYLKYIGESMGSGSAVAVDAAGRAWVAGSEYPIGSNSATPFPTVHPFQAETGQGFVSELAADGSALLFSSRADSANGLALDPSGNAFLAGYTLDFDKHGPSVFVARIDGLVSSAVTVEEPQRLTPVPPQRPAPSPPFEDHGVAPGEIVVLTGTGLGPAQEVDAQIAADGKVATSLAGTSVTFDGVPAPMLSVQPGQVICIVPFEVGKNQDRTLTMQVLNNGSLSNSIRLPFAVTAVEVLAAVNQDGTVNSPDQPAPPGSVVTVYAAGFGQTNPPSVDGQINGNGALSSALAPVGVAVGDQNAAVLYAGPAPGQVAGIVQINFRVPQLPPSQYFTAVGWGDLFASSGDSDTVYISLGPR